MESHQKFIMGNMMEIRKANKSDVDNVLKIQHLYHVDSVSKRDKEDGFITANFTRPILCNLIDEEDSLFILVEKKIVIGYAVICSWSFCSGWPNVSYLIKGLNSVEIDGTRLSIKNSCQYGPICIHREYRGLNFFEDLFNFCKRMASIKYSHMVTFINKDNERSFFAHTQKTNLKCFGQFTANGKNYYKLACSVK